MNVRILLVVLLTLGLAACAAPGSRYGSGYDSRGSDDRSYADSGRRHDGRHNDDGRRSDDNRRDHDLRRGNGRNFASCGSCGVVERIEGYPDDRRSSGTGVILGAIIGGVLGNQVGSGSGRKAATVAGAIGGGIAGNAIENNMDHGSYDVTVRLNNRRTVMLTQSRIGGMREGSRVVVQAGRAELL